MPARHVTHVNMAASAFLRIPVLFANAAIQITRASSARKVSLLEYSGNTLLPFSGILENSVKQSRNVEYSRNELSRLRNT